MEYRKLGESDLELSVIAFGAWAAGGWMWGQTEKSEAIKAIQSAYDYGVTSIDTAPIYGQGHSEAIVGEAIADIPRDKLQILTKFGLRWDLQQGEFYFHSKDNEGRDIDIYKYASRDSIIQECEDSLRRLGTDYIDLYQIHWPDSTTAISESFEAVERLIEQGKVRYAGVCNYNRDQMAEADKTLKLVSNQIPFSMVNKGIEDQTVPYCIENLKSILAYSPLERGLLTGKITSDYKFQEGDHRAGHPHFQSEFVEKTNAFLDQVRPIADKHKASLSQLVLKWTIERPGITIALAGARNTDQAISNAKAADIPLSDEDIFRINHYLEQLA